MTQPILQVSGLCKNFGGFRAVSDVSLQVGQGAIHALIGPNGAGKSTLLNLLAGGLQPSAGEILFHGSNIAGLPPHRIVAAGIARSFQITSIFPRLSVADNVRVALMARRGHCRSLIRSARRLMQAEVDALLQLVRLADAAPRLADELAAGDRKRLEFAMALGGDPQLMLLDEPTAGMSLDERALVVAILRDINVTRGVSVLFTEHDIGMVFSTAHRVTVLHQGRVIAEGPPAEIDAHAQVRELYLGEARHALV
jgi:branched-chain amino acid transport system ATP-binding protein